MEEKAEKLIWVPLNEAETQLLKFLADVLSPEEQDVFVALLTKTIKAKLDQSEKVKGELLELLKNILPSLTDNYQIEVSKAIIKVQREEKDHE